MKIHRDIEQGTPEWFSLRVNKATASCFADVMAKGQGKTREKYLNRVIAEVLTGKPAETYRNGDMDRGQDQEPLARWALEERRNCSIERVSFIEHDTIRAGCSPDGLIAGQERGIEIKSVIPTVQVATLRAGGYPSEHRAQVQGSMWITGWQAWEFCSYCPDMPEKHQLYTFTVERDEAYITLIEKEVVAFIADVDRAIARLDLAHLGTEELLHRSLKEAVTA